MANSLRLHLKSALRWAVYTLSDWISPGIPPLTEQEKNYLEQLRNDIASLPAQRGQTVNDEWAQNLATLRQLILNGDPRQFLRWPVILKAMFAAFSIYVLRELLALRRHDWQRWRRVIKESSVGQPYRYPLYPVSSGNLIHCAYHIAQFEGSTAANIGALDCIVEFGGGYGCMCRLIHNLGFRGRYIIFDLADFSALQRYYLQANEISVARSVENMAAGDTICLSDIAALRAAVARAGDGRNAMLIATWSLSEAPVEIRKPIFDLTKDFGFFLLAYQLRFAGIDNERFFSDWAESHPQFKWHSRAIPQLPGNRYLFGDATGATRAP